MRFHYLIVSLLLGSAAGQPAKAAYFTATSANLKAVFAAAGAGDTIALSGSFGKLGLSDRSFARPLLIDARNARFNGRLDIENVDGLTFSGGTFGSSTASWQAGGTLNVESSSNIVFKSLTMIADGKGKARGLTFRDSDSISLLNSSFTGFRIAAGANTVTQGLFSGNRIIGATSDGINIVNSHFVTATNNICTSTTPSAGAHPDCIQLWSLAGQPVQSDIRLLGNKAYGHTQGFTSFDPLRGGGLRIEMTGNYVNTTLPQGLACYACVDSRFVDNVLITGKGATYQTRMNIIGGGNNFIDNNSIGPGPNSRLEAFAFAETVSAVPEIATWAQLLLGFGITGALLRRRQLVGAASR